MDPSIPIHENEWWGVEVPVSTGARWSFLGFRTTNSPRGTLLRLRRLMQLAIVESKRRISLGARAALRDDEDPLEPS